MTTAQHPRGSRPAARCSIVARRRGGSAHAPPRREDPQPLRQPGARCSCSSSARSWHPRPRPARISPVAERDRPRRAAHAPCVAALLASPPCASPSPPASPAVAEPRSAPTAPGFLARPVARLHLPGRLDRLVVHRRGRDLRRAQQRRLVRFRLFPRHRLPRRRRPQEAPTWTRGSIRSSTGRRPIAAASSDGRRTTQRQFRRAE